MHPLLIVITIIRCFYKTEFFTSGFKNRRVNERVLILEVPNSQNAMSNDQVKWQLMCEYEELNKQGFYCGIPNDAIPSRPETNPLIDMPEKLPSLEEVPFALAA